MPLLRILRTLVAVAVALTAAPAVARAADPAAASAVEFFEKKVRPVLAEHCGKCHGQGGGKTKGGLRLASRADLLRGGDSGPALVPGDPAKSRLIEAIEYRNLDLQMPPKGKLPDSVIADLVRWVRDGAAWPDAKAAAAANGTGFDLARRKAEHWAWQPVRPAAPPAIRDPQRARTPVDRFVLAKLDEKGLVPAPPADRRTVLRRLTFDLTGLPPTVEEIDRFVADVSPDAYEKVVDRLLASPAYGERWARHWLDLVRYADSRGHEFDYAIPNAWQYRDYVIRAFNADLPYDQFVREQVAGDLLPRARTNPVEGYNESILGTGFWLLGEEVHSPVDIRQDLADRLDNRIDVFSKAFLGLTVSCARCHDHKFDAISAKDYYALFGILEGGSPRLVRFDSLAKNRQVAAARDCARKALRARAAEALAEDAAPAISRTAYYLLAARAAIRAEPACWKELGGDPAATVTADFSERFRARLQQTAADRKVDARLLGEWTAAVIVAGRDVKDPLYPWARLCSAGGDDSSARLAVAVRGVADELRRVGSGAATAGAGRDVVVDYATANGAGWAPDESAFGGGPQPIGSVRTGSADCIRFNEEAAATYDRAWDAIRCPPGTEAEPGALGRMVRAGRMIRTPGFTLSTGKLYYRVRGTCQVYAAVEGHGLIAGPLHGQLVKDVKAGDNFCWVSHDLTPYVGRRAHLEFTAQSGTDFAIAAVVRSNREPPDPWQPAPELITLLSVEGDVTPDALAAGYERMFNGWLTGSRRRPPAGNSGGVVHARFANWLLRHPGLLSGHELRDVMSASQTAVAVPPDGLVAESRLALALLDGNGADERVFVRGSYKTPGEAVPRRFLEALAGASPLAAGSASGRLELAEVMTDPARNPFLARVLVNRLWHHLFGRGIVASTDNFGVLGERPTHPELLDFLADRLVRDGWSVKTMIRRLVLSDTYRMDSRADAAADAADPNDLLLHRARLRRLEGEAIRDAILAVSGRLDGRMYGPAVPIHLTPFLEGRGRPASGPLDGNGRRSVYLAVRRNFLSPLLLCFDTPIPFSTVGRRTVSNVPAQALILLNDPFVHEQAGAWARRVLSNSGSDRERIESMYVAAFGRPPTDGEVSACRAFLDRPAAVQRRPAEPAWPWAELAHSLINAKEFTFIR